MIDILFVHTNASTKIYQGLAENHAAIEPPIWAAMLANSVRSQGHDVQILDAEAERIDYIETAKRAIDFKARIVCFVVYGQQPSASTQNMEGACLTASEFKKLNPDSFVVFVGAHVAALPKETMIAHDFIDAVCQNEGVYTLRDLLLISNLNDELFLGRVKGLVFRNFNNEIVVNEPSIIVSSRNLEVDLPGMAWDLLPPFKKYRTAGWHSWSNKSEKEPFAALYTSLGCPYRCSFCMINIINRTDQGENISAADSNKFRHWSPEFIIKQFDYFAQQGVKNIKIADELFVLKPRHFMTICKMIKERGYEFNIWAYSRVDTCKPEYLDALYGAGVRWLGLGIENPDEVLRREAHKDGFVDVKIKDVIARIENAGIGVGANYIFGLPNDTLQTMQNTLNFAIDRSTDMVNFYSAMAYPGSPLYLEAKKEGKELPETYSGYSQHSYDSLNLSNGNLTSAEIQKFRDYAWNKYHTNPKYLDQLEKNFGLASRKELEATTKVKLKRKLLGD